MKKVVGSIFRPRSNIDDLAMQRASGTSLTNRADVMSIGSLLVFEDSSALSAAGKKRSQVGNTKVSKKLKKAATGGPISGQDTVPALLTPGEFVISKGAASRIGSSNLKALNNADRITGYNNGGFVQRFLGGGKTFAQKRAMVKAGHHGRRTTAAMGGGGVGSFGVTDILLLQGVVSGVNAALGETSVTAKQVSGSLQALATAASTGIVAFQGLKMLPGANTTRGRRATRAGAGVLAGVVAIDGLIQAISNSRNELERSLSQSKLDSSLDSASKALERLAKNSNDAAARQQLGKALSDAVQEANVISRIESSGRASFMGLLPSATGTGLGSEYDNAASRVRQRRGISGGIIEGLGSGLELLGEGIQSATAFGAF